MGKIKSAWEIALEKTESIEIDENRIRHNATIDAIRRIAGSYLLSDEDTEEKTAAALAAYSDEDLKEALGQSIINSISLPLWSFSPHTQHWAPRMRLRLSSSNSFMEISRS